MDVACGGGALSAWLAAGRGGARSRRGLPRPGSRRGCATAGWPLRGLGHQRRRRSTSSRPGRRRLSSSFWRPSSFLCHAAMESIWRLRHGASLRVAYHASVEAPPVRAGPPAYDPS
jgi:hypothetical protein